MESAIPPSMMDKTFVANSPSEPIVVNEAEKREAEIRTRGKLIEAKQGKTIGDEAR